MKGGIYSDEKCPVCGSAFHDFGSALRCPQHPKCRATRFKVIFGKITKRFQSYDEAFRFLTGLRFKTDEATFDERDYRKDNPLGFSNISEKWLGYKKDEVRPGSYKNIRCHIRYAQEYFNKLNVKEIRYGHLEDFVKSLENLSNKSKHNIMSTIHAFFTWMKRRQEILTMPEFPVISFELGYRNTVDKQTQQAIIEEVGRICSNRKVYLGIKWLATYISIRPVEMISLKEGEIDLENRYLYFPHPKERKFKSVPILPEDVELIKSFKLSFPSMPFFRHEGGIQGVKDGEHFGNKYFYKWWKRACENLKIDGVDLYGGTRHSSVRALRAYRSPEEIKRAAMSETNKAFERYMGKDSDDDLRSVYQQSAKIIPIDKPYNDKQMTMGKSI